MANCRPSSMDTTVFDSNAILLYLAESTGKFLAEHSQPLRRQLLSSPDAVPPSSGVMDSQGCTRTALERVEGRFVRAERLAAINFPGAPVVPRNRNEGSIATCGARSSPSAAAES